MGVHATYCQICGLPVQHDHYVPTGRENYWAIYRQSNKPEGHFPFVPQHDWLLRGVAVLGDEEPVFGSCEDGSLVAHGGDPDTDEGRYVGDGYEDYFALHEYCWQAAGKPCGGEALWFHRRSFDWTFLLKYQNQLFDFDRLVDDDLGWMLLDPSTPEGHQNKLRIERRLKAKPVVFESPKNVRELMDFDVWNLRSQRYEGGVDFGRYRDGFAGDIDVLDYTTKFWVSFRPGDTSVSELETFERAFYQSVQEACHAVALATVTDCGEYTMALYARNPDACEALLAELCPVEKYQLSKAEDPKWQDYFEEFYDPLGIRAL